MTIQDLLVDPRTNNIKLIGDQSLASNIISSVNVIDNPDVTRWFKKDEVVLTSGYFFYNDWDFAVQVIHDLANSGCCALGIKIKRYLEEIPDEILRVASECGLAILEIPFFYALSDVMECIYSVLQCETVDNSVTEYNLFSSMMTLFTDASGLYSMIDAIYQFVHFPILLITSNYQLVSSTGFPADFQIENIHPAPWENIEPSDSSAFMSGRNELLYINQVPEHVYTLLFPNSQYMLCILSDNQVLSSAQIESISHTFPILELELTEHANMYSSSALSKMCFLDVLTIEKDYPPSELIRMCNYFGFSHAKGRVCSVLCLSDYADLPEKQKCIKLLIKQLHTLTRSRNNCFLCEGTEYIVLFFMFEPDTIATVAVSQVRTQLSEWYDEIKPFLPCRLHIGISSFTTTLSSIRKSYYDALKLADLFHIAHMPNILVYQDQLLYLILMEKTDNELNDLIYQTIGNLAEYERNNPSFDLITTYKTYIATHFNSTEAAKKMYIHRNTFSKRIEKINSLINVVSGEDRSFSSLIGICAYEILLARKQPSPPIT